MTARWATSAIRETWAKRCSRWTRTAAMVTAAAAPASAQPNQFQDGLVNVAVGDVTILEDVNIGVAAQVAANICGLKVGPVAVLGSAVDRSDEASYDSSEFPKAVFLHQLADGATCDRCVSEL